MKRNILRIDNIRISTREKFPIFNEHFFCNVGNSPSPSLVPKRSHEFSLQDSISLVQDPSNITLQSTPTFSNWYPHFSFFKKIVTWKQQQTTCVYILDSTTFTGTKMLLLRFFYRGVFLNGWVKLRIYVILCFIIFLRVICTNSAPSSR